VLSSFGKPKTLIWTDITDKLDAAVRILDFFGNKILSREFRE
jgi:hypothetical protein